MQRIATMIDIDGCLMNYDECFRKAHIDVLGREPIAAAARTWNLATSYGLTDQECKQVFTSDSILNYIRNAKPFPRAISFLKSISANPNNAITIVTSRGCSNPLPEFEYDISDTWSNKIRNTTKEWVSEHIGASNIDTLTFTHDKQSFAKSASIDMALEDAPHYVGDLTLMGITVFMPVWEYNEHLTTRPKVIPMHCWGK
jgi:hypothetical protein